MTLVYFHAQKYSELTGSGFFILISRPPSIYFSLSDFKNAIDIRKMHSFFYYGLWESAFYSPARQQKLINRVPLAPFLRNPKNGGHFAF